MMVMSALVLAGAFQLFRIGPYTPMWPVEMARAEPSGDGACATIMIANVLMENRESQPLRDLIGKEQPDVLFIVENDHWWSRELQPLAADYGTVIDQPQDDTYGLLFMTRLPSADVRLRHLTNSTIPSVRASLSLPGGENFSFFGLHPLPPRLGQETDVRDHELTVVAQEVRRQEGPATSGAI